MQSPSLLECPGLCPHWPTGIPPGPLSECPTFSSFLGATMAGLMEPATAQLAKNPAAHPLPRADPQSLPLNLCSNGH
jgi:hypothetical protein